MMTNIICLSIIGAVYFMWTLIHESVALMPYGDLSEVHRSMHISEIHNWCFDNKINLFGELILQILAFIFFLPAFIFVNITFILLYDIIYNSTVLCKKLFIRSFRRKD